MAYIIIGISGGVDSAVAAYLLLQQNHFVQGVFMKNWEEDEQANCYVEQDIIDSQAICDHLGIKLHLINFAPEYWSNVFEHFLQEYQEGRTPNPDILCNREIKFKIFLNYALSLGADAIATGHYAEKTYKDGLWQLHKGIDQNKDQSYFLYALNQKQLQYAIFPLASYRKTEIRNIAKKIGLPNSTKKDSTGICFIGPKRFKSFLKQYLPSKLGNIINEKGQIIGQHDGLMYYTLGQRKGLGIGGQVNCSETPWYVAEKKLKTNELLVVQGHNHPKLFCLKIFVKTIHWIGQALPENQNCHAKIRYRQKDQKCIIKKEKNGFSIYFDIPQRAATPGQSLVLYKKNQCLGGGIITKTLEII